MFYTLFSGHTRLFHTLEKFVFSAILSYFLYFFENFILLLANSGVKNINYRQLRRSRARDHHSGSKIVFYALVVYYTIIRSLVLLY